LVVTFCVGLELATGGGREISAGRYAAYMLAYAAAAPLGVALGIVASEGLHNQTRYFVVAALQGREEQQ